MDLKRKEYEIMMVPNIVNITFGRGVGYVFEETFDEKITKISATKIKRKCERKGVRLVNESLCKRIYL